MNLWALMIAAVAPAASSAIPAGSIAIRPGETVTLQVQDHGAVVVARAPAAPMTAFDLALLHRMERQNPSAANEIQPAIPVTRGEVSGEPPKPVADRVEITFRLLPQTDPGSREQTVLRVVNGYRQSFRYRVKMHIRGAVRPTDVCEVAPGISGTEYWPYAIDEIELTAAWLEAPEPGNTRCE